MTGRAPRDPLGMRIAAALIAVLGFVPFANLLLERRLARWYPSIATFWLLGGGAVILALALCARRWPDATVRTARRLGALVMRIPSHAYALLVALIALAAAAAVFVRCFGAQPDDVDQAAALFHAKILLSGRLSLPLDPHQEFFGMDNMVTVGRWFSHYPIGAPAVLVPGVAAGVPWLTNPLLVALTAVALYHFARRTYGEPAGRLAVLLWATSPFVMLMGASFASYVPTAALASLSLVQLARWSDAGSTRARHRAAALLGLFVGLALIVRPLDAAALTIVVALFQAAELSRDRRGLSSLATQLLAGAVPVALLLAANARTTGSPWVLGYDITYGHAPQLGFVVDPYGARHTPVRALAQLSKYLLELNMSLLAWPVPVLAIVVAGLARLRPASRWDWLLVGWLGAHCLVYSLFVIEGWFRGPRYLFAVAPAVILLTPRALLALADSLSPPRRAATLLLVPVCLALTWLPLRTRLSIAGVAFRQQTMPPALRVSPERLARERGLTHALVFVRQKSDQRTLFRLRSAGFSHGDAVRLLASAPVCALNAALDTERRQPGIPAAARIAWIVDEASRITARIATPTPCPLDEARDREGTAEYTPFFAANEIDADGRLGGRVVWATDLGAHDEVLRARFGDRTWYRLGPRAPGAPLAEALVPYVPER